MHITIGTQHYWVRTEADLVILCLRSRLGWLAAA
jgi:hypothetical protein